MTKNCNINDCESRHPKICIFKRKYGQCKFTTYCRYDHEKPQDILENSDKILELEKKIENLHQNFKVTDLSGNTKEVNIKIETLENKLKILVQLVEEKDATINKLEEKLRQVEESFEKRIIDLENKFKKEQSNLESLKGSLETMENENQQIKCDHCDFTTTSKKGLKTHTKRKHSVANLEQFPISCELCKEELGNKKDMRNHMLTHTYSITQNNQLKCEECTFIGDNEWTMYIHFGKQHSKPIECGLSQFKAKT